MKEVKKVEVNDILSKFREKIQGHYTDLKVQYDLVELDDYDIKKEEIDKEFVDECDNSDDEDENLEEELDRQEQLQIAFDEKVTEELKELKKKNFKLYEKIITLLYHDYVLVVRDEYNIYYKEDQELFEENKSRINSKEDLFNFLDERDDFYSDLISYFCSFAEMPYFKKRELFLKSNSLDKYLTNIFPLHILDKLYHTIEYTKDDLVSYFIESDINAIGTIIELLRGLAEHDENNYHKLMTELIETYYKNYIYKQKQNQSEELADTIIKKIEEDDIDNFIEEAKDNIDILEALSLEYYNDSMIYKDDYKEKVNNLYDRKVLIKKKIHKK